MKKNYQICPVCGKTFTTANYEKHFKACTTPESHLNRTRNNYRLDHDTLDCKFCGKLFKNRNGLGQHERACKSNPDRISKIKKIEYVHKKHNDEEIQKWFDYIKTKQLTIPQYDIIYYSGDYQIAKGIYKKTAKGYKYQFVHDLIANLLLDGKFSDSNTVHHLNKVCSDNNIFNLIIFIDNSNHKRFHNSNYAYLTYDSLTHLFSCELRYT